MTYFDLAISYFNLGQIDKTEIYFKKMLEIEANNALALFYYARI
jgi:tetratricopeptide (TPR) repeat protein